jgi:hypothetical protein
MSSNSRWKAAAFVSVARECQVWICERLGVNSPGRLGIAGRWAHKNPPARLNKPRRLVTDELGFVAGWRHNSDAGQAAFLNRTIMLSMAFGTA